MNIFFSGESNKKIKLIPTILFILQSHPYLCTFFYIFIAVFFLVNYFWRIANIRSTEFLVVSQFYDTDVNKAYVIRGNAAILKCEIPSFVADFVSVVSWHTDQDEVFYPANDYGLCEKHINFCFVFSSFYFSGYSLPSSMHKN